MINRLPSWFRQELPDRDALERARFFSGSGIRTICQEAHCPNMTSCFNRRQAAFMILGNRCARACRFCAVENSPAAAPDLEEPERIKRLVEILGFEYVVVTSVSRDDLADGGAAQFAKTTELIHSLEAGVKVELLIPDFQAKVSSLKIVLSASPEVVAHNIETVPSLYDEVRPQASYQSSLKVLEDVKEFSSRIITKSSLMLGLGEKRRELLLAMKDLRLAGCDVLTLGQYLAPSGKHYPVREFIEPAVFEFYRQEGLKMGFKAVFSGPLARSSYRAEELYKRINP